LVPKIALHVLNYSKKIAMTLPKQITAKNAAIFSAETLDIKLGEEIGYQYKGSDKSCRSNKTLILYATDGTIVSKLMRDPELKEYDCIIIDEAHERKVQIDFLLYLLRNTLKLRPEFKIIIMSATINENIFAEYYKDFKYKTLNIGGETNYPIKSIFLPKKITNNEYLDKGYEILKKILNESKDGDIIFFTPSVTDTKEICQRASRDNLDLYCIEVYSGMDKNREDLALDKDKYKMHGNKSRKLLMATAVAESSLTFPNIRYVIDSGYEFSEYYDPEIETRMLVKKLITHAQATQRMGRAGRIEAGTCYHLYTKNEYENEMKKFPDPSIITSNIYQECLKLLNYPNIETIIKLKTIFKEFIEPPKTKYIDSALNQLKTLDLVDNEKITKFGKIISEMQFDPTVSVALYVGKILKCSREILIIFSVLESSKKNIGEIFHKPKQYQKEDQKKLKKVREKYAHKTGDHLSIYNIINTYIKKKAEYPDKIEEYSKKHFLKRKTLDKAYKNYKTYKNNLKISPEEIDTEIDLENKILACISYGFRINYAYSRGNNNTYSTNKLDNLRLHRDSFLNFVHRKPSKIVYNELFSSNPGKVDITVASGISNNKIEELFGLISKKINSINSS